MRCIANFRFFVATVLAISIASSGCHRKIYRKKADCEVYHLIDQKACHSGECSTAALRIEVDPLSRMFDPFNPDRPPMPEDDPKSHCYMHKVDGKRGYPMWHAAGDTNTAENPDWWRYLPLDERGVLVLDADTAVQLAMQHSPAYQQQLEELYLSALDVTTQRFQFDTQFFGRHEKFITFDGRRRRQGGGNSSTSFASGAPSSSLKPNGLGPSAPSSQRPWSMERQFATGADLVVGLANQVVWEFSGPNTKSATDGSRLCFSAAIASRCGTRHSSCNFDAS